MKSASKKFLSIVLYIVLTSVLVTGVFAEESPNVITSESQFFNVGYSLSEGYGTSYWMLWNSDDLSTTADVPGDDALVLERFRNAVDTCLIWEDRVNQGISTLFAGTFSPLVLAVTLPDIIESWRQAEFAAEKADYFFSMIE